MGMLFARRRERHAKEVTTTNSLTKKEPVKVEPQKPKSVPTKAPNNNVDSTQLIKPKFKI